MKIPDIECVIWIINYELWAQLGGTMRTLKNTFGFLLCLSIASLSSTPFNACAVPQISDESLLLSDTDFSRSTRFGTYCHYEQNNSDSASTGYRKVIYDVYAKYDTDTFDKRDYMKIISPSSGIIKSVKGRKNNSDGSYISAEVIGFEPAQVDFFQFAFPVNGVYSCDITSSTDTTATVEIEITNAIGYSNSSDKSAPELNITIPSLSEYKPGKKINVNIEANELCKLEVAGKTYSSCTGVDFTLSADGIYTVKATDKNGNFVTKDFTIDLISRSTTTTTKKTTTATTTKIVPTLSGDANMDGKITIADSTAILQSLGNPDKYGLSANGYANADCYKQGGGVTANDALAIQMYDAKAITSLPVSNF